MIRMLLDKKEKMSMSFVSYLLNSIKKYQDHVAELLTSPAEKRLARVLLRLAHLDKKRPSVRKIPTLGDHVLAEMVGTTRSRVNFFMNRFRRLGYISYNGEIEINQSLKKVLQSN